MNNAFEENAQLGTREIQEGKTLLSSKPRKINVALTTACNIDCRMCEVKKFKWEVPERVVDEVFSFFPYLERVIWQGGEVFLYKRFKEILEHGAGFPHLTHEITTNAHLLNERWMELIRPLNADINVSVDGTTREVYEYIRSGSRFDNIIRNLELLKEAHRKGERVLLVTVMKANHDKLDGFADFAARYGFCRIILQPVKANDGTDENIFRSPGPGMLEGLATRVRRLEERCRERGIELMACLPLPRQPSPEAAGRSMLQQAVAPPPPKEEELLCYAPWQQLFVEWGGGVYPHCLCLADGRNEQRTAGSVLEETLESVWNGAKMVEYRQRILEKTCDGLCNPDCIRDVISRKMRNLPLKMLK
ncbi:MAG: radical SAM protein [Endomicrobiales bacterium]